MFRLLSNQVFYEPPVPSMIASVLKPKVGQTKRFCKKLLSYFLSGLLRRLNCASAPCSLTDHKTCA